MKKEEMKKHERMTKNGMVIVEDPSLDALDDVVLFPEKVRQANQVMEQLAKLELKKPGRKKAA